MPKKRYVVFDESQNIKSRTTEPDVTKKNANKSTLFTGNNRSDLKRTESQKAVKLKNEKKLEQLVKTSNDILFHCHTVFPFDLFPDSVVVDKTKVSIINKLFFFSETVHSILIKNIKDVEVEAGVLFATIHIIPDVYLGQTTVITYLHKSEAMEARRIIQGLILCNREGIDINDFDVSEIRDKIEMAGQAYYDVPHRVHH